MSTEPPMPTQLSTSLSKVRIAGAGVLVLTGSFLIWAAFLAFPLGGVESKFFCSPGKSLSYGSTDRLSGGSFAELDATQNAIITTARSGKNISGGAQSRFNQILSRRRDLVKRLAEEDAGRVLKYTLPESVEQFIADRSSNCLPKTTKVRGQLTFVHGDNPDTKKDIHQYVLRGESTENIILPSDSEALEKYVGGTIEVSALALDEALMVNTDNILEVDNSPITLLEPPLSAGEEAGAQQAVTEQLLAVLVHASGTTPSPITTSQVAEWLFGTNPAVQSVAQYYAENSYGLLNLQGQVLGQYAVTMPASCYPDLEKILDVVHAAQPGLDLSTFQHLAVMYPQVGCSFWGLYSKNIQIVRPYGTYTFDVEYIINKPELVGQSITVPIIAHEYGHSLSASVNHLVDHSNYLNCFGITNPDGTSASLDTRCHNGVYGDPYDVMGWSPQVGQFSAAHKQLAGWLVDGDQIKTVTQADLNPQGYADYSISPLEVDTLPSQPGTTGLKGVRIQRGGGAYLYIEYRQPIGSDADLALGHESTPNNVFDGGLLRTYDPQFRYDTLLLDASPDASRNDGNYSPTLPVSGGGNPVRIFTDPVSLATIEVISRTPTALNVRVRMIPDTVNPTVTAGLDLATNGNWYADWLYLTINASDDRFLAQTEYLIDGVVVETKTQNLLNTSISLGNISDGAHVVSVRVTDGGGNVTTSNALPIMVDNTLPFVSVVSPKAQQTVTSLTQIEVLVDESMGVRKFAMYLDSTVPPQRLYDNNTLCLPTPTVPTCRYTYRWDTRTFANGQHQLMVIAENQTGQPNVVVPVPITVQNTKDPRPPRTSD